MTACNTGTKIDSQKVAEEMRSRKVLHLNQAQITEATFDEGKRITNWLDNRLLLQLQTSPLRNDLSRWALQCNLKKLSADSLQNAHSATIQRIALRADSKALKLNDVSLQVWDAYRYNAENHLPMEANVQRDGEKELLYSNAILLTDATCLKCHGKVGKDLSANDFQTLKNVSSAMDSLINYQLNEPVGIWNILLDKAKLIQRIKTK